MLLGLIATNGVAITAWAGTSESLWFFIGGVGVVGLRGVDPGGGSRSRGSGRRPVISSVPVMDFGPKII